MGGRKSEKVPTLRVKKGDSLKTMYAKLRRAFTAADLARFAEIEEGVPLEPIIAELEAIQAEPVKKEKSKPKKKA